MPLKKKILHLPGNVYFGACKVLFVSDDAGKKRKKDFPTPAIAQKRKKPKPEFAGILGRCHSECSGDICHRGLWSGPGDLGTRWADFFLTELFCVFERQYVCAHMCMSKSFFMYVHVQIYACVYLLAGMYVSEYTCTYLSVSLGMCLSILVCVSLCVCAGVSAYVYMPMCVNACLYTCVFTYVLCNCTSL